MSEENGQVKDGVVEVKKCESPKYKNSPRTSKSTWMKIKVRFEEGTYKSLKELSSEYGVSHEAIRQHVFREKWSERKLTIQNKIEQRVESNALKLVDEQSQYLTRLKARSFKYEQMLDASVSQNSTTNTGVPLCDVEQLDVLSRTELRVLEMSRAAYKIPVASQVDVTSAGRSLGDSFVQAIQKLRESKSSPALTDQDLRVVLEADIVD